MGKGCSLEHLPGNAGGREITKNYMPAKVVQKPVILGIEGSTIKVRHPLIVDYTRTSMTAPLSAGGTTLMVRDNNNFEDNDWFILGESGNAKTEEGDVNGAVTRGTSLTITNTSSFAHEIDTPITRIIERGIKIYGAATDGGAGTLIESVDALTATTRQLADSVMIQWDRPHTEWTILSTDTAYAYYYATFTDGTTESSASDYVLAGGLAYNTGRLIVQDALDLTRSEVDGNLLTWDFLLKRVQDFQDIVTNFVLPDGTIKDWPFEVFEDKTSIEIAQNQDAYNISNLSSTLKYPDSNQGIIQIKAGANELKPLDLDEYERLMDGKVRTEVATQAAIGATSLVVDDTSEMTDDGSAYLSTQTAAITYTAKDDDTNTLSGIPASGTGSITATATVDAIVWQNISPATPTSYCLFNDQILFPVPPDSDIAGQKLKVKAYRVLTRIDSLADVLVIPFSHIAKWYVAAEIEFRKKEDARGDKFLARFEKELAKEALKYMNPSPETTSMYTFSTHLQ